MVQAGSGNVTGLAGILIASNNQITQNRNYLVANHIDMHHNVLDGPAESFLAACFGETGVYVGNRGAGKDSLIVTTHPEGEKAEAANLRMTVN